MYISYLSVNGPFVLALQKCFRIKFEVSKNGDKTKGWRERDDGGDTEGRKHHWLAPPGVKLEADSSDNDATVQVKNRNDLNSVDFPQSLNSTAWGNVISQTLSVVLDYLQLGRFDFRKYIFFSPFRNSVFQIMSWTLERAGLRGKEASKFNRLITLVQFQNLDG